MVGFASTSDADHLTQPLEDGSGASEAMRRAIQDAGLDKEVVDYINAHGTGTPLGDVAESTAIKRVFGNWAKKLIVSSTKSAIGHALGGSGGVEQIATIRALQQSVVPPTINCDHPDSIYPLDFVAGVAKTCHPETAMSNSFGFGGGNACLVVRKYGSA